MLESAYPQQERQTHRLLQLARDSRVRVVVRPMASEDVGIVVVDRDRTLVIISEHLLDLEQCIGHAS